MLIASPAKAGSEHNVSGYAWSENIGWISFNNTTGGGSTNYGVNLDTTTGKFSGYAWSENIGWISFNSGDLSCCPSGACEAKLDLNTYEVSGWARALSPVGNSNAGGWNGWMHLRGASYGVSIDKNTGEFHDWAWGGGDNDKKAVIGWISFNCAEGGNCSESNYKVKITGTFNSDPTATNLSVSKGDYCTTPAHYFSWKYSDPDNNNESRFQFQVDNNSDFSSPEINRDYTGLSNPSPTTNNQAVYVVLSPGSDQLAYNTTYYWRVRVYDEGGAGSGCVSGSSFTTEPRHYPVPDFNWSPENINLREDVSFSDKSTCYDNSNNQVSCSAWTWKIPDATYQNSTDSHSQNPIVEFTSLGSKTITLDTSDGAHSCSLSKDTEVRMPLPHWREVAP